VYNQPAYGQAAYAQPAVANTSGQGQGAAVPAEIQGLNWGAFLLNWIWGIFNGTMLALLCLIPFLNLIMAIVLLVKGNEWAWQNKRWDSVEHFKSVQRKWAIWGVGLLVAGILLSCVFIVLAGVLGSLANTSSS
jgi:hypothetical protein